MPITKHTEHLISDPSISAAIRIGSLLLSIYTGLAGRTSRLGRLGAYYAFTTTLVRVPGIISATIPSIRRIRETRLEMVVGTRSYLTVQVPLHSLQMRRSMPNLKSPVKAEYACKACRARIATKESILSWVRIKLLIASKTNLTLSLYMTGLQRIKG